MPDTLTPFETPPEDPNDVADDAFDPIAQQLADAGAESRTERNVKKVVPWVGSVSLHAALLLLGFVITWTVVLLQDEADPPLIIADFDSLAWDPVGQLSESDEPLTETVVEDRAETTPLEQSIADQLAELELDPLTLISNASGAAPLADFAPEPAQGSVSFVGLSSSNARDVVYVIDASGSMIASLPIVLEELARSLEGLTRRQNFAVVFFQRNIAVQVPPRNRLRPATSSEKIRALEWMNDKNNIFPSGRSNPIAAIEVALRMDPDVIFLLSENITGSGEFEIDQRDLLALLDELNPVEQSTGRRRTQINCIQFLDPDPLDTLRRIAQAHGGPNGYKFLDRRELGLAER